jgi:hypothetical protein
MMQAGAWGATQSHSRCPTTIYVWAAAAAASLVALLLLVKAGLHAGPAEEGWEPQSGGRLTVGRSTCLIWTAMLWPH